MNILVRLLAYGVSVWLSNKYAGGYWVVGPVFGVAVVLHDMKDIHDLRPVKHGLFIVFSTLIYALVYRISLLKWGTDTPLYNYVIGPMPAAIVTGSILMAFMHTVVMNKSKEQMLRAVIVLIVGYYFVTALMFANEKFSLNLNVQWMMVLIGAWQGLYLYTFFWKKRKG